MSEAEYLKNQLLIAMPMMGDPNFAQTVTLICEHSADGALGLILNKPLSMRMSEIFDQLEIEPPKGDLRERHVLRGGPMQTDRGFVVHRAVRTMGLDAHGLGHHSRHHLAGHPGGHGARRRSRRGGGRIGLRRMAGRPARGRDPRQRLAERSRGLAAHLRYCRSNRAGRPPGGCSASSSRSSARSAVMPEAGSFRADTARPHRAADRPRLRLRTAAHRRRLRRHREPQRLAGADARLRIPRRALGGDRCVASRVAARRAGGRPAV